MDTTKMADDTILPGHSYSLGKMPPAVEENKS